MTSDQQSLLEEDHRLDELRRSYSGEAQLNESFIFLTVGASLIATLGLFQQCSGCDRCHGCAMDPAAPGRRFCFVERKPSNSVPIHGNTRHRRSNHGIAVCGDGWFARASGLLIVDALPDQVMARLEPTLLDLGIALAAGSIATYSKVNPGAVSSMADTAIAVALVPPVCVMGLMLAVNDLADAVGAGLLYTANLLGILIGGLIVLAIREPYFQEKLRQSRRSRLPMLLSLSAY